MRQREPRVKDDKHRAFIGTLLCVACLDDTSVECAHISRASPIYGKRYRGKGEKSDDCWTVPLCSKCHRLQHEKGEDEFWDDYLYDQLGIVIEPETVALTLHHWSGDHERCEQVIREWHRL